MRKAKRILLIASALVLCAGGASPSWFRHKADKQEQPAATNAAAVPTGMTLNAIEIEPAPSNRLVLHTSGTPAYTSYSPVPARFIVDLTETAKSPSLVIPSPLPASIATLSVDEVSEMGTRITRVTLNLTQATAPQASAADNAVAIELPAVMTAEKPADSALPAAVAVVPASVPSVEPEPVKVSEPVVVAEPMKNEPASEPVASSASALPKAKSLKKIETTGSGSALEVNLAGDGEIAYKAFKLENPPRVVIDLNLHNKTTKSAIVTNDAVVKKIRVSQFTPDTTRVVLDLGDKSDYQIVSDRDHLRVTFGTNALAVATTTTAPAPSVKTADATPIQIVDATSAPAPAVAVETPKQQPKPKAQIRITGTGSDITSNIPTIAANSASNSASNDDSSSWKMPAKSVISAPAAQAAPPSTSTKKKKSSSSTSTPPPQPSDTTTSSENVFGDAAGTQPQNQQQGGNKLSGSLTQQRTLSGSGKTYTGEPISLNLKDAPIADVIHTFHELTGLNIAVDPGITGSVTVDFEDVPWDQALDVILKQNGLTFTLEGNVMRVGTVARLTVEAAAAEELAKQERLSVPTSTVSYILSYARAQEVAALLGQMASPRARIIVDNRTNQLIISEIPSYLQTMQHLIESVDVATRQVVIEARIVETSKTFLQQYGFNWGFAGKLDPSLGTGTGLVFPNRVDFIGGPFEFGPGNPVISTHMSNILGTFTLDLALHAAEAEGLVKVISAPRIMTQDNTAAEIQSGFEIPYQTRINFTTTIQYLDATLRLAVIPQITQAGTVIMDIQLQKSEPATGLAIEGSAGTPLSTRQARTRLMVRDGGTAVIAGIYQTKDNDSRTRMPFVHQIPVLGSLFKTHNVNSSHDELLIFITPRIVRSS